MDRALDVTIACVLILFSFPLMAVVALAIKLDSPGPVLSRVNAFGHERANRADMLKFRTTVYEPEPWAQPAPDSASDGFCTSPGLTICRNFQHPPRRVFCDGGLTG